MSAAPQDLIFNRDRVPDAAGQKTNLDYYADDPIVQLQHVADAPKTEAQRAEMPASLKSALERSIFGPSFEWAYRGYIVHPLFVAGDRAAAAAQADAAEDIRLLNDRPSQPVSREQRSADINAIEPQPAALASAAPGKRPAKRPPPADPQHADLILFNLLVALEWQPDEEDLRELEWAFRRASDLLYDITDGCMAFGQVTFGGAELMQCADIQIMASNRLLARSWVGGLHEQRKYMPIRVGRGVWHNVNRVTIQWDEPEAYRTLVHEWGHYALHLRDAYLDQIPLALGSQLGLAGLPEQALVRARPGEAAPYSAVMPKVGRASESIMETLEGTSELVARTDRSPDQDYEWDTIIGKYPQLRRKKRSFQGPGRLPLPLPAYARHRDIGAGQRLLFAAADYIPATDRPFSKFAALPDDIQLDRYWIYVLKQASSANPQLIAQGTLDARSAYTPFALLGAGQSDTLILIGKRGDQQLTVMRGEIAVAAPSEPIKLLNWRSATPGTLPLIEVLAQPAETDEKVAPISVRVHTAGGPPPDKVWLFPIGRPDAAIRFEPDRPIWESPAQRVPTLDGHVLVNWGDKLMIATFSQGGNPSSSNPYAPPPISPGSSDGNALLFFYDDDMVETNGEVKRLSDSVAAYYSRIKMITTSLHGVPGALPRGAEPRGNPFSITSNTPLPLNLHPTLIMYYDSYDERELLLGDVRICRLDGGVWSPLPTYLPPGRAFAAAPLDAQTAGSLSPYRDEARTELFMVCWIPRQA